MTVPPASIRPLRPADQAAARELILDGLAEHFGGLDASANPDLTDLVASYLDQGHLFFVAEAENQLAGTGGLVIAGGEGQIVRVSVARRFRRSGVGQALVAQLLRAAEERGCRRVWVETNDDWYPAIALYRFCGFHSFGHRDGCNYMAHNLPCNPNASAA